MFSFVGMKPQETTFNNESTINVRLEEDNKSIDEVVVSTGYTTVDRQRLTSAVTTVKMDDIEMHGVNRIDAMLEGRVPGLTFMQNTGQVGSSPKLRIRGTSTILGSQEPLWVVDGIIVQDPVNVDPQQINDLDFVNLLGNAIAGLNPDDIDQIDVLKDAAATALYGARAANGVIVITTKKGQAGPPTVSYTMTGTFTTRPAYTDRGINMMNSKERVELSRELMEMGVRYTGSYNNISDWIGYERAYLDYYKEGTIGFDEFQRQVQKYETMNTDWLKILTRNTFSHNHSVSINGGNQNIRYYASLGFADEQSNIKGDFNKRYSTSLKLTANYDKLSMQFGINGNINDKKYTPTDVNVMGYAVSMNRAIPLNDDNDDLWYYKKGNYPFNIVNEMNNSENAIEQANVNANLQLNYQFTKSFRLSAVGGAQYSNTNNDTWYGENSNYVLQLKQDQAQNSMCPYGGTLKTNHTRNISYTFRLQGDYNKRFGANDYHFINAMAGYELSSTKYNSTSEEVRGYYKDRGRTFADNGDVNSSTFDKYPLYYGWLIDNHPTYGQDLTNLLSGYATMTYSYRDFYILNFNARADWSNAFGSRSREKFLPIWSVSGRWNISENLFKDSKAVDMLAIKFSYGLQGNMLNMPTVLTINKDGYDPTLGSHTSSLREFPNPDLKWEKTNSYNIGVDFSILEGATRG